MTPGGTNLRVLRLFVEGPLPEEIKMGLIRKAEAVVYHRALRSIGRFAQGRDEGKYVFWLHCSKRAHQHDPLQNGLPDPLRGVNPERIFAHLGDELEALCQAYDTAKKTAG